MLLRNFPNLKEKLIELRDNKVSLSDISNYFNSIGYRGTRNTVTRWCEYFGISTERKSYFGTDNPYYGKRHSESVRKHLSDVATTQKRQVGDKNYFFGKSGNLSPNWKGGKSSRNAIFYSSDDWRYKRLEIFNRDGFSCQQCGFIPKVGHGKLNVHHIVSLGKDFGRRLENDNLITLCVGCHKKTFGKESELESMFEDIVRTRGRPCEESRNVFPQSED